MNVQSDLKQLVSKIKALLPADISNNMAYLLEEFPEDFASGCQLKPGKLERHFSPKEKTEYFDTEAIILPVLISWYFSQSVAIFNKDFSNELIRTEGVELSAEDFLRLTGNPVYIPLEKNENNIVGCLFSFYGERYENPKEKGNVIRIDVIYYYRDLDDTYMSQGGFGLLGDDGSKIDSSLFKDYLNENSELTEQTAKEITNKLFYLLSDEPETILWRKNHLDSKPKIVKHKRRANTINVPKHPRITLLGEKFGEEIRQASVEIGGSRTVKPHIRRAHWHVFLCGKGRTEKKIRWIKPVFVHSRSIQQIEA